MEHSNSRIRKLINDACDEESLNDIIFDCYPNLYHNIKGRSRAAKIRQLVEVAKRQRQTSELLSEIKSLNPNAYAEFEEESHLNHDSITQSIRGEEKTTQCISEKKISANRVVVKSLPSIKDAIVSLIEDSGIARTPAQWKKMLEELGLDTSWMQVNSFESYEFLIYIVSQLIHEYPVEILNRLLKILEEAVPEKQDHIRSLRCKLMEQSDCGGSNGFEKTYKPYEIFQKNESKYTGIIVSPNPDLWKRLQAIKNNVIREMEERLWLAEELWVAAGFDRPHNIEKYSFAHELYFAYEVEEVKLLCEQLKLEGNPLKEVLNNISRRSLQLESLVDEYPIFGKFLDKDAILEPIKTKVQGIQDFMLESEVFCSLNGESASDKNNDVRIKIYPLERDLHILKKQLSLVAGGILKVNSVSGELST